jgi:hypothetical protein
MEASIIYTGKTSELLIKIMVYFWFCSCSLSIGKSNKGTTNRKIMNKEELNKSELLSHISDMVWIGNLIYWTLITCNYRLLYNITDLHILQVTIPNIKASMSSPGIAR